MSVDPERLRAALSEPAPVMLNITPDVTEVHAAVERTRQATPADLARVADLVDRSSLGTEGARQLQQRTSDEEAEAIRRLVERERGSTP